MEGVSISSVSLANCVLEKPEFGVVVASCNGDEDEILANEAHFQNHGVRKDYLIKGSSSRFPRVGSKQTMKFRFDDGG